MDTTGWDWKAWAGLAAMVILVFPFVWVWRKIKKAGRWIKGFFSKEKKDG